MAKENARNWFVEFEQEKNIPAFKFEHFESMKAILNEYYSNFKVILEKSKYCLFTGYRSDGLFYDTFKNENFGPSESQIRMLYINAWNEKMLAINELMYIEEKIRNSDYEFFDGGKKFDF